MTDARIVPLEIACRSLAEAMRPTVDGSRERLGDIELWPHQRDAVRRVHAAIAEFGGALVADDVGTGKTFIALAAAAGYGRTLVVAPAALRERWFAAGQQAGTALQFVSFESLSRGREPPAGHDFVIVDEAHHARNPKTTRYRVLAKLVAVTAVLLLTATPIHNRRDDLVALLALFLGAGAATLDEAALGRCIVRRGREILGSAAPLPTVRGPIPVFSDSTDDATPAAILALPPPVPAADAGVAAALLAIGLLRQWSSSQGALLAAIRRRLAAAHALAATLDDGRYPTRAELAAWTLGDDAQQVVMTALLAEPGDQPASAALSAAVAAHIDGLRALRRAASADPGVDSRRARQLRDICRAHDGARTIAFTQFAETVSAYWAALRDTPYVCALTARGARVANGSLRRAEALGAFSPRGARPGAARRIDTLIVTDLASEGLDLQLASVLVHLDLPWTPARLEQRVGRVVRPASPHRVVHVYSMEPPLAAAALLDIRRRLAAKLADARLALGDVMPDLGLDPDTGRTIAATDPSTDHAPRRQRLALATPVAAGRVSDALDRWRILAHYPSGGRIAAPTPEAPMASFAHITASVPGWLALAGGAAPRLIAALGDHVSDAPALVAEVCALIDGALATARRPAAAPAETAAQPPNGGGANEITAAAHQLSTWLDSRRAASLAGVPDIPLVRTRRRALTAVARIANAPASARLTLSPLATRALTTTTRPLGASLERDLQIASGDAATPAPLTSILAAIAALPPNPARHAAAIPRVSPAARRTAETPLVMIVLAPAPPPG